jgi:hypothetical protein
MPGYCGLPVEILPLMSNCFKFGKHPCSKFDDYYPPYLALFRRDPARHLDFIWCVGLELRILVFLSLAFCFRPLLLCKVQL